VSDAGNQVIWTVAPITKLITKLAGQLDTNGAAVGASNFAKLNQPHQLVRVGGNQIVAADYGNNRLVLVQRNGTVITNNTIYHLNSSVADIWFGQNGDPVTPGSPKFVSMILPFGVAAGNAGEIFTSESYYHDIRGLTGTGLTSPTFTPGVPLPYYGIPAGIALNNEGTVLYVTDPTNNTVSALNFANNQTTAFLNSSSNIQQPVDVASDSSDNVYVLNVTVRRSRLTLRSEGVAEW
jgi:DNA-binding beta-propeller fold protein YncE